MTFSLRTFTPQGSQLYSELFNLEEAVIPVKALELALDDKMTRPLLGNVEVEFPRTRFDVGASLWPKIGPGTENQDEVVSAHFWNWYSARIMKQALDTNKNKLGARVRWLAVEAGRGIYRMQLNNAYLTYSNNIEDLESAMVALCQPVTIWADVVEQTSATKGIAGSVGVKLANALYYDPLSKSNKKGTSGKGPGSPRRLVAYFSQIKLTIDFKSMTADELLGLLPAEFDEFRK